nr:hypothetical protein FFPRI1PSEUD_61420 [Pseudomonas sp. FFPRI_1]
MTRVTGVSRVKARVRRNRKRDIGKPREDVAREGKTRRKPARKRSLLAVNEHSEPVFNAVLANAAVFTQLAWDSFIG